MVRKNVMSKMGAIGLAAVMMMGIAVPAFAATTYTTYCRYVM